MSQMNTRQLDIINPGSFFGEGANQFIQTENMKRQIASTEGMQQKQIQAQQATQELASKDAMAARLFAWKSQESEQRHRQRMEEESRRFTMEQNERMNEMTLRSTLLGQELSNARAKRDATAIARIENELQASYGDIRRSINAANQLHVTLAGELAGLPPQAAEWAREQLMMKQKEIVNQRGDIINHSQKTAPSIVKHLREKQSAELNERGKRRNTHLGYTIQEFNNKVKIDGVRTDDPSYQDMFARSILMDLQRLGINDIQLDPDRLKPLFGLPKDQAIDRISSMMREQRFMKSVTGAVEDMMTGMSDKLSKGTGLDGMKAELRVIVDVLKSGKSPMAALEEISQKQQDGELSAPGVSLVLHILEDTHSALGAEAEIEGLPESEAMLSYYETVGPLAAMAGTMLRVLEPEDIDLTKEEESLRKGREEELRSKYLGESQLDEEYAQLLREAGLGEVADALGAGGFTSDLLETARQRMDTRYRETEDEEVAARNRLQSAALQNQEEPDIEELNKTIQPYVDMILGKKR